MPLVKENEPFMGSGIGYLAGRDCGNASEINFAIEKETKPLKNYRGGGGNAATHERISGVRLSMKIHSAGVENLALMLRAKVDTKVSEVVTDQSITASLGRLIATPHMIDTSQPVTIKNGATEIARDGNFDVSAAGIIFDINAADITDAMALTVSYTSQGADVLQVLTESAIEIPVVIDGVNDYTGKPHVVKVHRFKPDIASALSLITDDFAEYTLEGEVLADTSKPAGKSQFFEKAMAN